MELDDFAEIDHWHDYLASAHCEPMPTSRLVGMITWLPIAKKKRGRPISGRPRS
jgi:hypothetical protein